jgi:hypothetical protein
MQKKKKGFVHVAMFPTFQTKVRKSNGPTSFPHLDRRQTNTGISQEKMPLVSIVKDDKELSSTYGKEKLPKSLEDMQRHGVKITSYTTTEDK